MMSHIVLDLPDDRSIVAAMKKAGGSPVIICAEGPCPRLERIVLGAGVFDEEWLQALIFDHPQLVPVGDIEPGFGDIVPVAREIACGHGFIDNLYLTPSGEIVLVETKLWRNLQARREVVAQALDYVSALMGLGYGGFEAAVLKACGAGAGSSLHGFVVSHPDALDEAAFVDTVSRNLKRGRMLVIALGDGIRREAEALASLLQSHAGAHFTFALVELATWRDVETGDIIAVPSTLAQTVMIERGIVVVVEGVAVVKPVPASRAVKAVSISEEMFYEELGRRDAKLPQALKAFLSEIEPLGVCAELKASLNLKVETPDTAKPHNLGYITKNGQLWTNPACWTMPQEVALAYNQALASLIGGEVATHDSIYLSTNGRSAPSVSALLPEHQAGWINAIAELIRALSRHDEPLA